jgi:hypothetical protein
MNPTTITRHDVTIALAQGYGVEDIRVRWRISYQVIAVLLEGMGYPKHRRIALRYAEQQRRRPAA